MDGQTIPSVIVPFDNAGNKQIIEFDSYLHELGRIVNFLCFSWQR